MKTAAIIQARMGSTRLPGKSMADLGGMPVLGWVVRAATAAELVDEVWVATPDMEIYNWAISNDTNGYLGDEDDVLSRFKAIAEQSKPDLIVRLTADCPFLDPVIIDQCVQLQGASTQEWPDGMDVQVFRTGLLYLSKDKEHVVDWPLHQLARPGGNRRHISLTIDTAADLDHARMLVQFLPKDRPPHWRETLDALQQVKAAA